MGHGAYADRPEASQMPKRLTEADVEAFHTQGFLPPLQVLSDTEVRHFRQCLEAFERNHPEDRLKLKSKSHILCPWVVDIARHPKVLDPFEDLLGPDILCYSMAFRIKEPDGRTHAGWHQDGASNPIKPILVIGALALGDCSVEHGCLRVIPGSHRTGVLPHVDTGNPESILSRGQYIDASIDESKAVPLELRAGEIALFNAGLIHSSPVNQTNERRLMLLVEMMPTAVEARAHRDSAMLVRGHDAFQRVNVDPPARTELGDEELQAWRKATSRTGRNIFANSPLPTSELYGGAPQGKR